tara:strand:- start:82 stop:450 length:369 start_codon:yes stop_codon:yes gene_type:complete
MADRRGISGRALARKGSTLGTPPFILHASVSTTAATLVSNLDFKIRVVDMWCNATGGGSCGAVTLTDGTNTIATTASMSGDKDIGRADEIDDAYYEVDKDGKLAATVASSGTGELYVLCVRI